MQAQKIVLLMPDIFGVGKGLYQKKAELEKEGYRVIIIDPYERQGFRPAFFLRYLARPNSQKHINALAARIDMGKVIAQIHEVMESLPPDSEVFGIGNGLSGVLLLLYDIAHPGRFKGIATFYPHILFPKGMTMSPPDLLKTTARILLFFGDMDSNIEPGTLDQAIANAKASRNVQVRIAPGAKHAFALPFVQNFPNPLHWLGLRAARTAWKQVKRFLAIGELRGAAADVLYPDHRPCKKRRYQL